MTLEPAQRESTRGGTTWNFTLLTAALVIGLVGQMVYLPCLCIMGNAKITFALVFDGLIVVRIAIARFRKERGGGWIFYAILCCTSPIWITVLSSPLIGRH